MKTEKHAHKEITQPEVDTVARTLGPVSTVKFLQQLEKRAGHPADQTPWHSKSHAPTLPHKVKTRFLKQP